MVKPVEDWPRGIKIRECESEHPFVGPKEYPDEIDFWLHFAEMVCGVVIVSTLAAWYVVT